MVKSPVHPSQQNAHCLSAKVDPLTAFLFGPSRKILYFIASLLFPISVLILSIHKAVFPCLLFLITCVMYFMSIPPYLYGVGLLNFCWFTSSTMQYSHEVQIKFHHFFLKVAYHSKYWHIT
jgi:hypothetical protein